MSRALPDRQFVLLNEGDPHVISDLRCYQGETILGAQHFDCPSNSSALARLPRDFLPRKHSVTHKGSPVRLR
jgi:hypothetical protein